MDHGVPDQNVAVYGEEDPQYQEGHYEADEGNYRSFDNIDHSAGIKHDSSSSAGKLFVGGIAWETSEEAFNRYFSKYGEVIDSVIMMDKISGRPRGFGFVTFADPEAADKVLLEEHVIDGRTVEVKRTVPREDMQVRGVMKTKKIFVGGLPVLLTQEDLREYFSSYGNVMDHQIMVDHETGRSRGFGFVTFENEDAVENIISDGQVHELCGKRVEIKRAEPKRSGFDHSTETRFHRGGPSSKSSANFTTGSGSFHGGYGEKMGREYGGYSGYGGYAAGYGNFNGNYASGAAGYYPGYGGYGYGYGFGGPMYGGAACYGGSGFGTPIGYGGAAGYGVSRGYGRASGGYDGGKGFGGGGGGYGPSKWYGGGGDTGGYGNSSATSGRFHPYRK